MSYLNDLYQEIILDHTKRPRNHRRIDPADRQADGHNPLCGDRLTVFLKTDGELIEDISFEGAGCAISTASASLMTESLKGKTVAEAEALARSFRSMITGQDEDGATVDDLGKLEAFAGVAEFPTRVKCATLAWHTFQAALEKKGEAVSTE
jgi:nitrogen fixation NifU-like protein